MDRDESAVGIVVGIEANIEAGIGVSVEVVVEVEARAVIFDAATGGALLVWLVCIDANREAFEAAIDVATDVDLSDCADANRDTAAIVQKTATQTT